jgi:hypothetical protein
MSQACLVQTLFASVTNLKMSEKRFFINFLYRFLLNFKMIYKLFFIIKVVLSVKLKLTEILSQFG